MRLSPSEAGNPSGSRSSTTLKPTGRCRGGDPSQQKSRPGRGQLVIVSACGRLFKRMVRWYWREAVVPAYHLLVFDGAAARIVKSPRRRCARERNQSISWGRSTMFRILLWFLLLLGISCLALRERHTDTIRRDQRGRKTFVIQPIEKRFREGVMQTIRIRRSPGQPFPECRSLSRQV